MANLKAGKKSLPWLLNLVQRRALLVIGDFSVAVIAMVLALLYWGSNLRYIPFDLAFLQTRVPIWFYLLPVVWVILLVDLYNVHRAADWKHTLRGVAMAALVGLGLYLILFVLYVKPPKAFLPRLGVAGFLISASLLTLLWRRIYIQIFTAPRFIRRVMLVGGGTTGQILLKIVNDMRPKPFQIVGIIDDDPQKQNILIEGHVVLGSSERLLDLIAENEIAELIVAISGEMRGSMFQALLDAQEQGVEIVRMQVAYEELLGRVPIRWLEADWILRSFVDEARPRGFYELAKRLVDIIGGLFGVLLMLLLLPFVAVALLLDDGAPIFYAQTRYGKGGQPYRIYKFRTMRRDAEPNGTPYLAQVADPRTTRIGRLLRKTRLDEFPQFFNVLRGEMSLVGPRAERPELVDHYQQHVPFYRARLLVKPGLSGWAQVNFGYASDVEETIVKLEYDLYYIKHRSPLIDFVILLRTPFTMLGLWGR